MAGGRIPGSKLILQSKINPLSEARLSVIIRVQSPFMTQPVNPLKDSSESYEPAGKVPPNPGSLSFHVPVPAFGSQQY